MTDKTNSIEAETPRAPLKKIGNLRMVFERAVRYPKEIAFALEQKKTIIPLLSEGYSFDAGTVPAEIKDISSHNAITILPEFYEAAVERLARRFIKLEK